MGYADLHIHSIYSDGTATIEAILHYASTNTDLDIIAITDHDTLSGSLKACELADSFRVEVVPGMEITTREGHLLALFLCQPVKSGLSFVETAQQVRLFGGLPIVPHPKGSSTYSIGTANLHKLVRKYPRLLAGIEAENGAMPPGQRENRAAQTLRWEFGLPGLGGSDAHILSEIGSARTAFVGQSAQDLRAAIEVGQVVPLPTKRASRFYRRHMTRFLLRYGFGIGDSLDSHSHKIRRMRVSVIK